MIKLVDVYKSFGEKKVLEGFSLEVEEGETMALIGYSGTGKSVAIKHIVGLLEPDSGEVWVDGLNVPDLPRKELYELRSHIGYVFQFAALFDSLSVQENVAYPLREHTNLREAEIVDRVVKGRRIDPDTATLERDRSFEECIRNASTAMRSADEETKYGPCRDRGQRHARHRPRLLEADVCLAWRYRAPDHEHRTT